MGASWGRKLAGTWWVRSLVCGAFASACDYALVLGASKGFGLPGPVCTTVGLLVGTSIGFTLNRGMAFKDAGPLLPALLRYAAAFSVLMALHALAVGFMTGTWKLPLVVAKACADLSLLAGGQLLLLRYVVFPRDKGRVEVALQHPQRPARSED